MNSWTIFGPSNFIGDIIDAIHARHDTLAEVVTNIPIDSSLKTKIPLTAKLVTLAEFAPRTDYYIFGYTNANKEAFLTSLEPFNIQYSNLIHPKSYISYNVELGFGNYIGPNAVLAPGSSLGNFNYINRCASVGHDSSLKDFNHLGPNATICGMCTIGNRNFVGAGGVVKDRVSLADDIILGAGSVTVKSLTTSGSYIGIPSRKLFR